MQSELLTGGWVIRAGQNKQYEYSYLRRLFQLSSSHRDSSRKLGVVKKIAVQYTHFKILGVHANWIRAFRDLVE